MSASPDTPGGKTPPVGNVHGRRAGRGVRPYLIIVKIVGVGMFFGGLAATLSGVLLAGEPASHDHWRMRAEVLQRIYAGSVLPGLWIALASGTALFAGIWRAMIRMRWFVAKMVLLALAAPTLHVFLASRTLALACALGRADPDLARAASFHRQILIGTIAAIAFAIVIIVLGRVKPRLGQDYGRTFGRNPPQPREVRNT